MDSGGDPAQARQLAQTMALAFTASTLLRGEPSFVADAFCASRLRATTAFSGAAFGTLPSTCDRVALVRRASGF
jgi:putative acyl-CoA dehydrogenase